MFRDVIELLFLIAVALVVVPPSEDATVELSLDFCASSKDGDCSGELSDSSNKVFLGENVGVVSLSNIFWISSTALLTNCGEEGTSESREN